MSTLTHDECRDAVASDDRTGAVAAHLDGCAACATFARRVGEVTAAAPGLAADAVPPALADRVVAAVHASGARPVVLPFARRAARRTVFAAAAAVALFAAATLVAGGDRGDDAQPKPVLVAAAESAERAGGVRVKVDVQVEVSVNAAGAGAAAFAGVPVEARAYMQGEYASLVTHYQQLAAQYQQYGQDMAKYWQDYAGSFTGDPMRLPPVPLAPQAPPVPSAPPSPKPPPEQASMKFDIDASGRVDFGGDEARLRGSLRPRAGTLRAPRTSATFDVVVDGDQGAVRAGGGAWASLGGAAGPLGRLLLDAGALPDLLRAGAHATVVARTSTLTQYRYRTETYNAVDVYVDGHGRAVRVRVSSTGSAGGVTWGTHVDVHVVGYGSVDVDATTPATSTRVETSTFLYPFGPVVATALR